MFLLYHNAVFTKNVLMKGSLNLTDFIMGHHFFPKVCTFDLIKQLSRKLKFNYQKIAFP